MKKNKVIFILLLLIVFPNVLGSKIKLQQEWGFITSWEEQKYISNGNLIVETYLLLELSEPVLNDSDKYNFQFCPWEPNYLNDAIIQNITLCKDCDIALQYFNTPRIYVSRGRLFNYSQDYNYELISSDICPQKAINITIFLEPTIDNWAHYKIYLNYQLIDFVQWKGNYYFQLDKFCTGRYRDNCPKGNAVTETVFLADPDYKLDDYPEFAKKSILQTGHDYIRVEGMLDEYEIRYTNIKETTLWTPLFRIIMGALIGGFTGFYINEFLKKRKFEGNRYYCKKCKHLHNYNNSKIGENHKQFIYKYRY